MPLGDPTRRPFLRLVDAPTGKQVDQLDRQGVQPGSSISGFLGGELENDDDDFGVLSVVVAFKGSSEECVLILASENRCNGCIGKPAEWRTVSSCSRTDFRILQFLQNHAQNFVLGWPILGVDNV